MEKVEIRVLVDEATRDVLVAQEEAVREGDKPNFSEFVGKQLDLLVRQKQTETVLIGS